MRSDTMIFEGLFRNHYAPLCAVAARYIGSSENAEDVVQDVFARLWKRRGVWQWCGEEDERHLYVYVAVRHEALKQKGRDRLAQEVQRAIQQRLPHTAGLSERYPRPDEEMHAAELARAFRSCVGHLPRRCREAYALHWNGMSRAEIAAAMGTSVRTVETQIARAKKALRRKLAPLL